MTPSPHKAWGWRLWIVASLLFVLAAWIHPERRVGSLSLAVVFGVLGMSTRARNSN